MPEWLLEAAKLGKPAIYVCGLYFAYKLVSAMIKTKLKPEFWRDPHFWLVICYLLLDVGVLYSYP